MGVNTPCRAKEEDITQEEETEAVGGKGNEGCNSAEQMFCMWAYQKSTFTVSILCEG